MITKAFAFRVLTAAWQENIVSEHGTEVLQSSFETVPSLLFAEVVWWYEALQRQQDVSHSLLAAANLVGCFERQKSARDELTGLTKEEFPCTVWKNVALVDAMTSLVKTLLAQWRQNRNALGDHKLYIGSLYECIVLDRWDEYASKGFQYVSDGATDDAKLYGGAFMAPAPVRRHFASQLCDLLLHGAGEILSIADATDEATIALEPFNLLVSRTFHPRARSLLRDDNTIVRIVTIHSFSRSLPSQPVHHHPAIVGRFEPDGIWETRDWNTLVLFLVEAASRNTLGAKTAIVTLVRRLTAHDCPQGAIAWQVRALLQSLAQHFNMSAPAFLVSLRELLAPLVVDLLRGQVGKK